MKVVNRCEREDDEPSVAEGEARVVPGSDNAKLKVRFDNWFSRLLPKVAEGNYWVIALDKDYQTVVIGEPGREYLWILARQPRLPDDEYRPWIGLAEEKGFRTSCSGQPGPAVLTANARHPPTDVPTAISDRYRKSRENSAPGVDFLAHQEGERLDLGHSELTTRAPP